jgi:hypothetical protein
MANHRFKTFVACRLPFVRVLSVFLASAAVCEETEDTLCEVGIFVARYRLRPKFHQILVLADLVPSRREFVDVFQAGLSTCELLTFAAPRHSLAMTAHWF